MDERALKDEPIPGWATLAGMTALIVSLVALGNFIGLFVLFSQMRAVSLANLETAAENGGPVS